MKTPLAFTPPTVWAPFKSAKLGHDYCYMKLTIKLPLQSENPIYWWRSQPWLPILKSEKEAVSPASTVGVGSFLSNPKNEQFWNASRLLAIRRFRPPRLSLRIISSPRYLEDGMSKSNGPKESGCIRREHEKRSTSKKVLLKRYKTLINYGTEFKLSLFPIT